MSATEGCSRCSPGDCGSGQAGDPSLDAYFDRFWREGAVRSEVLEGPPNARRRSRTRATPSHLPPDIPLSLHARYSRAEIVAALGFGTSVKPKVTQGGILWVPGVLSDVFFVDLHKAERDYSPTTMYRDYAISPRAVPLGVAITSEFLISRQCSATSNTAREGRASCSSFASARHSSSGLDRSPSWARRCTSIIAASAP